MSCMLRIVDHPNDQEPGTCLDDGQQRKQIQARRLLVAVSELHYRCNRYACLQMTLKQHLLRHGDRQRT